MDLQERRTDLRVGVFVTLGLVVLTAVVFIIGQERRLFETPVHLKALFPNVAGLKLGAPVRLAGVDVGIVSNIEFPGLDEGADKPIVPGLDASTVQVGTKFPLSGVTQFENPVAVSVTGKDPTDQLLLNLRVVGTDAYGNPKTVEDIRLRVTQGNATAQGIRMFKRIDQLEVVEISGNTKGTVVEVRVGRAKKITVIMRITNDVIDRIRLDSEAKVDSMGLLGDKTIDISLGSRDVAAHEDGDYIKTRTSLDIDAALTSAQRIIGNVEQASEQLRVVLSEFSGAGGEEVLVAALRAIRDVVEEVQGGKGLLHALVYDQRGGQAYRDVLADLTVASEKLKGSLTQVDSMLGEVRTGDGLANALIYGKDGEKTLTEARNALAEAAQILEDVRTKQGVVHNLIYDEDKGEFITNLNEATHDAKLVAADVKAVMDEIEKGQGTLGALIKDPTVYEDLKTILGNTKRNAALKALIRLNLQAEDRAAEDARPRSAK
jgi:phospholipid/cholesterol/gamma-HCH transport system substrate-binding protein